MNIRRWRLTADPSGLPKYALAFASGKEVYLYAMGNPEEMNEVNYSCGCMQIAQEWRIYRRGLLDCFFKDDGPMIAMH